MTGCNNSFYDINICKDSGFMDCFQAVSSLKMGQKYKTLSNGKICILDQIQYCSGSPSLDAYLKSRKTNAIKGHFPYKWLTRYNKLYENTLPEYKYFESNKTTKEEYDKLFDVWKDNNMTNMFDYLRYYNNLDVVPLVEAITKHRKFYYEKGFDMHKDAISLSGLAERLMFNMSLNECRYNENVSYDEITQYDEEKNKTVTTNVYEDRVYLIDEENKDCFYKLKNNNVGGPAIVFHRYHEKDITRIVRIAKRLKKYDLIYGSLIKKILGFDANALYLYALSQYMPTGLLTWQSLENCNQSIDELLKSTFGFYEVDIKVPDELYDEFSEFPPFFRNCYLKADNSKKLISCMSSKKMLIYHPLLQWYVDHGLIVTKVYGMIHCKKWKCLETFTKLVSDERRKGDVSDEYKIIGEEMKNIGNSAYGRTSMNKSKHMQTDYEDISQVRKSINSPYFVDADKYGDTYEVSKKKHIINQNIPIHISTAILQYAKLRMLQFYYDFLVKYVDKMDFQMMYMDTDSMYMAITKDKFDDLVKPCMREEYEKDKCNWFPRDDTPEHAAYDKRTAGLFKVEFEGDGMVALAAKLYYVLGCENKDKFSCKGVQKKNNSYLLNYTNFKKVLDTHDICYVENSGMRYVNHQVVWYSQYKAGLSAKYNKRHILDDNVSTMPLEEDEYDDIKYKTPRVKLTKRNIRTIIEEIKPQDEISNIKYDTDNFMQHILYDE